MRTEPESRDSYLRGIGFRASVAVNALILSIFAGFILYDAVRDTFDHIRERAETLDEQAMAIHGVVSRKPANALDVQRYIDAVCQRMSETTSPGHHIVVESGGRLYQSQSHGRASAEIASAIQIVAAAPEHWAAFDDGGMVAGVHSEAGTRVYVAERLDGVLREVWGRIFARSLGVVAVGLLLAGVIHWLLHRLVARPLRRLVRTIESIRTGNLGAESGPFRAEELDRLAEAVNAMSRALANDAERRRLALAQARRVQQNLLPRSGDIAPGVQVAAIHHPAEAVGGDYYDVLPRPDGTGRVLRRGRGRARRARRDGGDHSENPRPRRGRRCARPGGDHPAGELTAHGCGPDRVLRLALGCPVVRERAKAVARKRRARTRGSADWFNVSGAGTDRHTARRDARRRLGNPVG